MAKPSILVAGLVGAGKSTVVSAVTGEDAPSDDTAVSVTREIKQYVGNGMVLFDTPGMGDPEITTRSWCSAAGMISGQKFEHLLFVMNGAIPRVSNETVLLTIALKHIVKLDIKGVTVVFTRASQAGLTEEKAQDYMTQLGKASKQENMFNSRTSYCFFDFDMKDSVTEHLKKILPHSSQVRVVDVYKEPRKIMKDIVREAGEVNDEVGEMAEAYAGPCFHCDSAIYVRCKDGSLRITTVAEVKTGDLVRSCSPNTGSFFDEEVIFTHNHAADFGAKVLRAPFVKMSYMTDSGGKGEFRVTCNHYVLRWSPDGQQLVGPAQYVVPGEALSVVTDHGHTEEGRIVNVEMSNEPLATCFFFLTRSGYAVVDDVVASCMCREWDAPVGRLLYPIFSQFPILGRVKENPTVARAVAGGHMLLRLAAVPM